MISEIHSYVRLRDLSRLIRMEDHDIFIQLIVGFAVTITTGGI
jgi:hypothetical protein